MSPWLLTLNKTITKCFSRKTKLKRMPSCFLWGHQSPHNALQEASSQHFPSKPFHMPLKSSAENESSMVKQVWEALISQPGFSTAELMRTFSPPVSFWTFERCRVRRCPDLSERRICGGESENERKRRRGRGRAELFRAACEIRLQILDYFASEYVDVRLLRKRDILLPPCNTVISPNEVSLD